MNKGFQLRKLKAEFKYLKLQCEFQREEFEEALLAFNEYFKDELALEKSQKEKEKKKHKKKADAFKKVYKKIATKVHPDKKTGDKADFQQLKDIIEKQDIDGVRKMARKYGLNVEKDLTVPVYESAIIDMRTTLKGYNDSICMNWYTAGEMERVMIENMLRKNYKK